MEQKENVQENNKTRRTILICVIVLALLITVFAAMKTFSNPAAQTMPENKQGNIAHTKTITIEVIDAEGNAESFRIETGEEYLRGALEQENLIAGDESEFGMMVTTVNGLKADDANQEWWCFTKGGEQLMTGVDTTPIADGDTFEITLKTGW